MMEPLISIVMPVKNAMPYLRECLDSIIAQSYQNWELIAINDGSSDQSGELLKRYSSAHLRIRSFQNTGRGIIPALQLAYSHASGSYISRMDADDIMSAHKLTVMRTALDGHEKSIAVGQVAYFSSDGELGDGYRKYQNWLNSLTVRGENFKEIYKECVIPSPCWMMYKEDFDAIGGFHSEIYPEDYDLAFRMYQAGYHVLPCDEVIHRWRDYPTRTSRTDDNYADNRFLDIKVHYFLAIDYDPKKPLVLWGAGKKGKHIARLLIEKEIPFKWICDNPKKIGHDIYGVVLEAVDKAADMNDSQIIVAVAGAVEQIQIQESKANSNLEWYWFC